MESDYRKLGMADAEFRLMLSDPDRNSNRKDSDADQKERERRRKRKSRWGGDEMDKAFILGMPTVLPTNLSKEQEEAYLLQLQIEEVSRKLRTGDLGIPANPEERCSRVNLMTYFSPPFSQGVILSDENRNYLKFDSMEGNFFGNMS